MLIKVKSLKGYKLHSLDGEIGKIKEFYFDDRHWTIRYLVVDTGSWLVDRQVLISPYTLIGVNKVEKYISINLTKKQIEDSPSLGYATPVSRQFERSYYDYYGWPIYWGGAYMWGTSPYFVPTPMFIPVLRKEPLIQERALDYHLHSTNDVSSYDIQARDGEIGHVDDFIIDDETWAIRYMVVDTQKWLPGRKVLISPRWIDHVNWENEKVVICHTRESIKLSPEYTDESLLTREYETGLHENYNCEGYWIDEETYKKGVC